METLDPVMPEVIAQSPVGPQDYRLEFRGSAAEYFRIWIVNLALTIVTLGIYSAWAKVRRLKYLHGHTYLDGSSFGYHGEPRQILKGRALAALLLLAYVAAGQFSPVAGAVAGLILAVAVPWLLVKAMKFRTRMTSWRGIRFNFKEDFTGAYRVYWGWGLATVATLGLLFPQFVRKQHQFAFENASFGSTHFKCDPPLRPFYVAVLLALLVGGVLFGAVVGGISLLGPGDETSAWLQVIILPLIFVPYLVVYAIYQARVLNAVYNHTSIGPHQFRSGLGSRRLAWLYLTNVLAILVSLGLLIPWATIRLLRYRLEAFGIESQDSLDNFVAAQDQSRPGAAGDEISDFFDVDFGL
jgi:uncharacterized membrane protein YjgN (DUF898 family)